MKKGNNEALWGKNYIEPNTVAPIPEEDFLVSLQIVIIIIRGGKLRHRKYLVAHQRSHSITLAEQRILSMKPSLFLKNEGTEVHLGTHFSLHRCL